MKQNSNTQIDYTAYEVGNQLLISLECDVRVPKDDPVRLLSAIMDRVDYSRRNHYLVENANLLLAAYDGQPAGTAGTVAYAKRHGVKVVTIEPIKECVRAAG